MRLTWLIEVEELWATEWKPAEDPFQRWWTQGDLADPNDRQPSEKWLSPSVASATQEQGNKGGNEWMILTDALNLSNYTVFVF